MKLIVGLGNPGDIYKESRHNIGFSVIRALSSDCGAVLKRDSGTFSLSAKAKIDGRGVILAMPLTYMNLSGSAVAGLLKKHKIDLKDLLIVLDDLDLELGRLRIRPAGSSAGHRGLQSIIDSIGGSAFSRLRIGIGRPPARVEPSEYVLLPFSRSQKPEIKDAIQDAVECCSTWVKKDITETMNIFNKKCFNIDQGFNLKHPERVKRAKEIRSNG